MSHSSVLVNLALLISGSCMRVLAANGPPLTEFARSISITIEMPKTVYGSNDPLELRASLRNNTSHDFSFATFVKKPPIRVSLRGRDGNDVLLDRTRPVEKKGKSLDPKDWTINQTLVFRPHELKQFTVELQAVRREAGLNTSIPPGVYEVQASTIRVVEGPDRYHVEFLKSNSLIISIR
ncbi:MAG: hypothetical protein ABFD86_10835 [Bryobacteraceae bacterium]